MDTQYSKDEPPSGNVYLYALALMLVIVSCKHSANPKTGIGLGLNLTLAKDNIQLIEKKKPAAKKRIFITFDDGPNKGTRNVLRILEEEDVPATFFLVGQHINGSKEQQWMWDSLRANSKLELCNHSFTHAWNNKYDKFYQHPDSVLADFNEAHSAMSLTNYIARTPGRNAWRIDTLQKTDILKSKIAIDNLQKNGYILLGWDLEWFFDHKTLAVKQSPDDLLAAIDQLFAKNRTRSVNNLVLLAHDQVYGNAFDSTKLHQFIKKLKERPEYELAIASDYPNVQSEIKKHARN